MKQFLLFLALCIITVDANAQSSQQVVKKSPTASTVNGKKHHSVNRSKRKGRKTKQYDVFKRDIESSTEKRSGNGFTKSQHNDSILEVEDCDVAPTFSVNMNEWLSKNLFYPVVAAENGVQGEVVIRFVIEKNGKTSNPSVVNSVDPYLDKEALRVAKKLPKFNPAMKNGKPVRVYFTLPFKFALTNESLTQPE